MAYFPTWMYKKIGLVELGYSYALLITREYINTCTVLNRKYTIDPLYFLLYILNHFPTVYLESLVLIFPAI